MFSVNACMYLLTCIHTKQRITLNKKKQYSFNNDIETYILQFLYTIIFAQQKLNVHTTVKIVSVLKLRVTAVGCSVKKTNVVIKPGK